MIEEELHLNSQIIEMESQTSDGVSQKRAKKNQTDNVKWSIFTEAETKVVAVKAAKKAGLKLNEWIDRTLREAGTAELTKKAEPPAKTEDLVQDIIRKFAEQMRVQQDITTKTQNDLIEQQGKQIEVLTKAIENQPNSLKELIFGKKNS